jgi:hypothetical protein
MEHLAWWELCWAPASGLPRNVTVGHSRQWRTLEGPTACWADMEAYAGHGGGHWPSVCFHRHFKEHTNSIAAVLSWLRNLLLILYDDGGVWRCLRWRGEWPEVARQARQQPSFPLAKGTPSRANVFARIGASGKKHYTVPDSRLRWP